jgi:N-formylglutamate deformylase
MASSTLYRFQPGRTALLLSVPHAGRELPPALEARLTAAARLQPDTDWYVDELYDFAAALGASVLVANYSRYVVDLNRAPDDAPLYAGAPTSSCIPLETFAGEPLYLDGAAPTDGERAARLRDYWQPYHRQIEAELARLSHEHGRAVLLDGHSIIGEVPRLFEGVLPTLNLGFWSERSTAMAPVYSCSDEIAVAFRGWARTSGYDFVENGRFKGGYITRHYGAPARGRHSLQLEINQSAYLEDPEGRPPPMHQANRRRLGAALEALCRALID